MKTKFRTLYFVLFMGISAYSQTPEQLLQNWSSRSPIEKVYLHFDRDSYICGETIWFKAYLYSDYNPDTISTTLYVELVNDSSRILDRKALPVFAGITKGQFELPDSLLTGIYTVRAYSPTMLNYEKDFICNQRLQIYGQVRTSRIINRPQSLRLEFFPEGGNIVADFTNTIAFKATDENGMPVNVHGVIKNSMNQPQVEINSYHDGMGKFNITAKPNDQFYAVLNEDSSEKYALPAPTNSGIVFRVASTSRGEYYNVQQVAIDPALTASYMIGQMQHHVVFRQEFSPGKKDITGIINTKDLNSGILQITVFNKDHLPLAERLIFINNKEYIEPIQLIEDTIRFSAKAKNLITLKLRDVVQGSLSVAVTDADFNSHETSEENIYSRILLSSDLKGSIHNPAWYFSEKRDSVNEAIDLLMMVNGWRRFKWENLLSGGISPIRHKDPGYITLSGNVMIRDSRKIFPNKPILVLVAGADSSRILEFANTDAFGNFKLDSLVFFDRSRILFSDIRGWKSRLINIKLIGDTITRPYSLPNLEKNLLAGSDEWAKNSPLKLSYEYDSILKAKGVMLKRVIVKVHRNTAIQDLEDKYVSGMFSTNSEQTIDLVNEKEPLFGRNVFEYLQGRVAKLQITRNGNGYSVLFRPIASFSTAGFLPMRIFLDEMPVESYILTTIPLNEIALIKIFGHFAGAEGGGAGGVLAIYTKKGTDLYNSVPSTGDQLNYQGYSIIKEFYSPDYLGDTTIINKTDQRITLQWTPNVIADGVNEEIPVIFYNSDRTRRFKIVVQGMTSAGKMIYIEKIISAETGRRAF